MAQEALRRNGMGYHKKERKNDSFIRFSNEQEERRVNLFLSDVVHVANGTFGTVSRALLFVYYNRHDEGNVVQVTGPQKPQEVAVKIVYQNERYKNRELEMTKILDHPNIVQFKYYFKITKDNSAYLGLIMEYLPINFYILTQEMKKKKSQFDESALKSFAKQLLSGLEYIHEKNICHRDLKPQNVLVDATRTVLKICDFGSSKKLVPTESNVAYICSRHYRAPELILGNGFYTTAVDVWALGCVLAEAVLLDILFKGHNSVEQLSKIAYIIQLPDASVVRKMSPLFDATVFLHIVPLTLKNALKCDYQGFVNFLEQMLKFCPDDRLSCKDLLALKYLN